MKKIGILFKGKSEGYIKGRLDEASAFFIVRYSGLSSPALSTLRRSLRDSGANLFVVKNSVAKRALQGAHLENLLKFIEGPCAMVFTKEEPVGPSKVLYNFLKEHEQLKLEAGMLEDRLLSKADIESLAQLPSREILRARVVGALNAPIAGLVITLAQLLAKFVHCIDQIRIAKGAKQEVK